MGQIRICQRAGPFGRERRTVELAKMRRIGYALDTSLYRRRQTAACSLMALSCAAARLPTEAGASITSKDRSHNGLCHRKTRSLSPVNAMRYKTGRSENLEPLRIKARRFNAPSVPR